MRMGDSLSVRVHLVHMNPDQYQCLFRELSGPRPLRRVIEIVSKLRMSLELRNKSRLVAPSYDRCDTIWCYG